MQQEHAPLTLGNHMNSLNENTQPAPVHSGFYLTFFLALFLGNLGVHRLYNGKVKSGILQLITFGGCGVWLLVDLITILLGKFKDKNGSAIRNVNPLLTWLIALIPFALLGVVVVLGALGLAAAHGSFGKDIADSIAKAKVEAETKATVEAEAEVKAEAEGKGNSKSTSVASFKKVNISRILGDWEVDGNARDGTSLRIRKVQNVRDGSWTAVQVVIVERSYPIVVRWVAEFDAPAQSANGWNIEGDFAPDDDVAGVKRTYHKARVEVHFNSDGKTGTVMLHGDHFKMKR